MMTRKALVLGFIFGALFVPPRADAAADSWHSQGPFGGNVMAFAIDPSVPSTVYAGTEAGLFRSIDGGVAWQRVEVAESSVNIQALAVDPHDSAILHLATRTGAFRSTDAGASWSAVNDGLTGLELRAVVIDPTHPSTVYLAGYGGVHRSTNRGASWTLVGGFSTVHALALSPSHPQTLYAASFNSVFKTMDGGNTWSEIGQVFVADGDISALAVDPTDPATVYVGTRSRGIFKTANSGLTWTSSTNGLALGHWIRGLAVDPTDPSTVYAGMGGVFKSTDGGATWHPSRDGMPFRAVFTIQIHPAAPSTLYAGINGLEGLYKSTDAATSWTAIHDGLHNTFFEDVVVDPLDPSKVYAGGFITGFFKSPDGGHHWTLQDGYGFAEDLLLDPAEPSGIYMAGNFGVRKSIDAGETFNFRNNGLGQSVDSLAIDPQNPSILYAGTSQGVFKTTNGADSWTSTPITDWVPVLVIDSRNPSIVYAGTRSNGVWKTVDGAATWVAANVGFENAWIRSLAIDPADPAVLYAGTWQSGLWKTVNGGVTWTELSFPDTYYSIPMVAVDPRDSATVYASNPTGGLLRSTDAGLSWQPFDDGLGGAFVNALAFHPQDPAILFVGTMGLGVFERGRVAGPRLVLGQNVPAVAHSPVAVPLALETGGADIASLAFSIDYDETCLDFDPTDADFDGIPDALAFTVPAAFAVTVSFDPTDTGGEIDVLVFDVPPQAVLPDGPLASLTFTPTCTPQSTSLAVPVAFSRGPEPSYGGLDGTSIAGSFVDGSVEILPGIRGDCNGDNRVDAGDISACGLEIFDNDGSFWLAAGGGSFAGNPTGCDANGDTRIDAGDLSCKGLLIFDPASGCAGARLATNANPRLLVPATVASGTSALVGVELHAGGAAINSIAFRLRLDPTLGFDASDADADGVPDAVRLLAVANTVHVSYDAVRRELDVLLANLGAAPLPFADGTLVEIALDLDGGIGGTIGFADVPEPSFGAVDGSSVTGTAEGGAIFGADAIFFDGFETGNDTRWSSVRK